MSGARPAAAAKQFTASAARRILTTAFIGCGTEMLVTERAWRLCTATVPGEQSAVMARRYGCR